MTTIFTDGRYLIADCATTTTKNKVDPGRPRQEIVLDQTRKIKVVPDDVNFYINKRDKDRIVAMAFSGDVDFHVGFEAIYHKYDNLDELNETLRKMALVGDTATGLFLTESGTACIYYYDGMHGSVFQNRRTTVIAKEHGTAEVPFILGIGSGAWFWRNLRHYYTDTCGLPLIDHHLAGVALDLHSSLRYDVYGLAEKKLVTDCRPDKQGVSDALDRVTAQLKFRYRPRKIGKIYDIKD